MFGEINIYGTVISKLDGKGRLIIPSFTNVEAGDELVISKPNRKFFEISCLKKLSEHLNSLKSRQLMNQTSVNEIKSLEEQIEFIISTTIATSIIDNQHRILIPSFVRSLFFPENEVIFQGAIDRLRVFPTKNEYIDYINMAVKKK